MELNYANANKLLCQEFAEMKAAYDSDLEEYEDGTENTCYTLYESEFERFILRHLKANDRPMLEKIFAFLERLMESGDHLLTNMVGVAITESLYFDGACDDYRDALFEHCGEKTLGSFYECLPDEDKAEWQRLRPGLRGFYESLSDEDQAEYTRQNRAGYSGQEKTP